MGVRYGGRAKGTPNKRTQQATELLQSLNFDPLAAMVEIARNPAHSPELRGRMASELARYAYPQLKSVERTGTVEHTAEIEHTVNGGIDLSKFTNEQLEALEVVSEAMDSLAREKIAQGGGVH